MKTSTDPVRVADGHLQSRQRTSRAPHHGGLGDAQSVEQAGMGVGLRRCRCISRHGRAQVAEARHRDDANAVRGQPSRESHALVMPTTAAMYGQQRHPASGFLVFDGTAARLQQHAALCRMRTGALHVDVEAPFDEERCSQEHHGHGGKQGLARPRFHGDHSYAKEDTLPLK